MDKDHTSKQPYLADTAEIERMFGSSFTEGLTKENAMQRLNEYGQNKLAEQPPIPLWRRFVKQLADPMIIVLIVAAVISAITGAMSGDGDFADVAIIMFVVIVNSILSVAQEAKSESAMKALQEMGTSTTTVIRDGRQQQISSHDLVPGDIIILAEGDAVPADCRIVETHDLRIEEAALTGESVPVEKTAEAIQIENDNDDIPLGDRRNMAYMGSTVVHGRGIAIAVETGMNTEMGKIAGALNEAKDEQTPLQLKLAELSRILTFVVLAICIIIFAIGIFRHGIDVIISNPEMILDTFMVAVSLAVAAIPEGLVAVITIVLSIGVSKMAQRNAIIRKLSAVETLGCTQVICSDKTGTLTQNKMTVVERYAAADKEMLKIGMAACSDATWDEDKQTAIGEPTECALVNDAGQVLNGWISNEYNRVAEAPFDSSRKMMSVIVKTKDGKYIQYTKGAPDIIIARCTQIEEDGLLVPLADERKEKLLDINKSMAGKALRVLALAYRKYDDLPDDISADALEHNLVFCGLDGMIDPIRDEVKDAIGEAHAAGIRTVIITGDHIDTAIAIAKQLGIAADTEQAITGQQLDKMIDEQLDENIERYSVYARVQPEHKTRIVEAWQRKGNIVAMTGDGVNDAPSIKKADIGIGMGITGTDVTKGVADMILADDNFTTIVSACEEGRRIYDNIRKVIQFLLSANLAEVFSVFIATIIGFTIFQPIQLLWINLATDCFPALALGMENAEGNLMERKPRSSKDGIFAGHMGIDCIIQGMMITILVLISFFVGIYLDMGYIDIQQMIAGNADLEGVMMAFITLTSVEIFHSINMRSRRESIFRIKTNNKWLILSSIVAIALTVLVVTEPHLSRIFFGNIVLPVEGIIAAIIIAMMIIPMVEIQKAIMRRIEK